MKIHIRNAGRNFRWQISISGTLLKSGTSSTRRIAREKAETACKEEVKALEALEARIGKPKLTRQAIRTRSVRRQQQMAIYRPLKAQFLKDNPFCCVPGCAVPVSSKNGLHHSRGRVGKLLCAIEFFRALCDAHHECVKSDPNWARSLDLLPPVGQYNSMPKPA